MILSDLLKTSVTSLMRNRSRSILTILGIVIGIAAVMMMLSIGRSSEGLILNQVANLGSDLVFVEASSGDPMSGPPSPYIEQTLTLDDIDALNKSGYFSAVTGVIQSSTPITREETSKFVQVVGVNEDYLEVFPAEIASGRFLDQTDIQSYAKVVVLGKTVAEDLFGDQDPIGQTVKLKKVSLKVIGVFPELGTRFFQNQDEQIVVPITTAQRDILGLDNVTYIAAKASGDIDITKEEAQWVMRDSHNIDNPTADPALDDFAVSSQSDAVAIVGIVGGVLTILLASIAAISLVVGGIGIMNIMLVSVTERTKEIGLRKAIGATYKEILQQFLLESVLLTMFGGIIGIISGVGFSLLIGYIVGKFVDGWSAAVPLDAMVLGVLVSTTVGIVFGLYPARRAARLDPIEALRFE
ncbi:MAG: ABC transporter permease [Patescibacteria group bacterium]|jgi:putative ABC transport system permease protein